MFHVNPIAPYVDSIEWAAGLFEGEGSIGWHRHGRDERYRCLTLQLKMTDEDVVRRFAAVAGCGNVHGPYHYDQADGHVRKPYWTWKAQRTTAEVFLRRLYPMLGERRRSTAEPFLRQTELVGV